jgi:cysteine desulfurase
MEDCRARIKTMLGIRKQETLLFTASATESNNMVLRGRIAQFPACKTPHVIISSIEHSSIHQTCLALQKTNQCSLSIIPTDCQGRLDLRKLSDEVQKHARHLAFVGVILANNEIGVLQDIAQIAQICRGYFLHVDATQYVGKYPLRISSMGVQSLTFGSHKFHGPRMGALYVKDIHQLRNCCCTGGRSEYGLRSGTPNIAYILGMEKALSLSLRDRKTTQGHVRRLRDYLETAMTQWEGVRVNGGLAKRLYNTLSVVLPIHGKSRQLVQFLDRHNICVNVGSACNRDARSRILEAIGLTPPEQSSTLRISLCHTNTRGECDRFLRVLQTFLHPTS